LFFANQLVSGVHAEAGYPDTAELSKRRDAMIAAMQKATVQLRKKR
jgi:hypothetical protein